MTVLQKLLTAGLPAVGLMIAAWANPTLNPDSEYRLWLNRNANKNFASSDGGVLPDTEYVFYTGPAR